MKLKNDPLFNKEPSPVSSLRIINTEFDEKGNPFFQRTYHWIGKEDGIKADEWKVPKKYREDFLVTKDCPTSRTSWYDHDRWTCFEQTRQKAFVTLYPKEETDFFSYGMSSVPYFPDGWKTLIEISDNIESVEVVQLDGIECCHYKMVDIMEQVNDRVETNLYIDTQTALCRKYHLKQHHSQGGFFRECVIQYFWNEEIDPSILIPKIPEHITPIVVDLSLPAPERRIEPLSGIEGINLGMHRDEVVDVIGEPEWEEIQTKLHMHFLFYFTKGFAIHLSPENKVKEINCYDKNAFASFSFFRRFSGKTPDGIGIGSTFDSLKKACGKPLVRKEDDRYIHCVYPGMRVKINKKKKRIDQICINY